MATQTFARERLDQKSYDLNNPLEAARFQQTVLDFMELARVDESTVPNADGILTEFCEFVDDPEVWHLAQTVVPEFRSSAEAQ